MESNKILEFKSLKKINLELSLLVILFLFIIFFKFWVLQTFGFIYTDSDQTLMWLGANHYSQGIFYEPRFYGQEYNSMLEAFLAIPLIKIGFPFHQSLPIVTTFLSVFPVFLLSIITYLRQSKITVIILLCIYLTLPIEYSFITSMPRGFVTGIAFSSLSFLFLHKFHSKYAFFFVLLITVLAYSINANSVVLSIPICILFFLKNYTNKSFYFYSALGLTLGVLIHLLIARFYINHPFSVLHTYKMEFSLELFTDGLYHLDRFFNFIIPVFWHRGWLLVLSFLPIAFVFYKNHKYEKALTTFIIPFLILGTLFISKVHDGTSSIFFSYARMYLAVPIVLLLMLSFISINQKKWMYISIVVAVVFSGVNLTSYNQSIDKNMNENHVVTVLKSEAVYEECSKLLSISEKYNVELIVINNHWYSDVYNYGCPACMEHFPNTLRPNYERRTWRLLEDENKVYSNVLVIDLGRNLEEEYDFILKLENQEGLYLIKNNKLSTLLLLNNLKLEIRQFK